MTKKALSFDLGASGGRAMLGEFDGSRISLRELHRFENVPVTLGGTLYWDFLKIFGEIGNGLTIAQRQGGFDTIGFDSWGVDFGLIGRDGHLMENPIHYRDKRTTGMDTEVCDIIGRERLYNSTGIQIIEINTLFQMYSLVKQRPEILERASSALLIPDLIGYFLTGEKRAEYCAASTTQMMNPVKKEWESSILSELGIQCLFPTVTEPGSVLGRMREMDADVISVAGHDTASAVVAVPARENDFLYISSGTWSLFGTELSQPLISEQSLVHNMTNEGGFGPSIRFLKNIVGLWLIQETRRQFARDGHVCSYADLEWLAIQSEPFAFFIDPDAPDFASPGDMPARIREYCGRTGQGMPSTEGAVIRCIYESLAMKHRYVYKGLLDCMNSGNSQKTYRSIHMLGGGARDRLLCQMIADATGLEVIAGPVEATALGNVAVQLISQGVIGDIWEARSIIRESFEPEVFEPANTSTWDEAYDKFIHLAGL